MSCPSSPPVDHRLDLAPMAPGALHEHRREDQTWLRRFGRAIAVDHALRFLDVHRDRLFHQDMDAALESPQRHVRMIVMRRRDDDAVQFDRVEHLQIIGELRGVGASPGSLGINGGKSICRAFYPFRASIADGNELRIRQVDDVFHMLAYPYCQCRRFRFSGPCLQSYLFSFPGKPCFHF